MRGPCCCAQGAAGVGSPLAAPLVLLPVLLPAPVPPPGVTLPALTPAASAAGLGPCGCAVGVARGGAPAVVLAEETDWTATVPVTDCLASVLESTGRCTMLVSVAGVAAWWAGVTKGWFSGKVTAYGAGMLLPSARLPQVAPLPRKGLNGSGAATVPAADRRAPPAPIGGATGCGSMMLMLTQPTPGIQADVVGPAAAPRSCQCAVPAADPACTTASGGLDEQKGVLVLPAASLALRGQAHQRSPPVTKHQHSTTKVAHSPAHNTRPTKLHNFVFFIILQHAAVARDPASRLPERFRQGVASAF